MRAQVRIEVTNARSEVVDVRQAKNAVMQAGADLVARLFAGSGSPITHMGVGTNDAPESDAYNTETLTNEAVGDLEPLVGDTEAPIPADAFDIELDEAKRLVRVRVRGTLPAAAAVGTVREAGLISRSDDDSGDISPVLYNRVTFAPITKGDDHELTMFWEVTFPYGDLHWMS